MKGDKYRWGNVRNVGVYTDIRIGTLFFKLIYALRIFCHITVVCCHVVYMCKDLFKCKINLNSGLISVSSYFKVIFKSASF